MKETRFKFINDANSDVLYEAYGRTAKEAFENAAIAISTVMCKIEKIGSKKTKTIALEADTLKDLLFDFLQEIINIADQENLFLSKFEVELKKKTGDTFGLRAVCTGEPATPAKREKIVKALTYYKYEFEKNKDFYKVKVSLDI